MLNIGMESLKTDDTHIVDVEMPTVDDMIEIDLQQQELFDELAEFKQSVESLQNLLKVCDTIQTHGGYVGFENLVSECEELSQLLGVDIRTVSAEQLEDLYSNEIFRDTVNAFFTKVGTLFGRLGDRIGNFIKTLLPFKEKYYGEMKRIKAELAGKKIDDAKFQEQRIASAMPKGKYQEYMKLQNNVLKGIEACCEKCTGSNIDKLLNAADQSPDNVRTTFGLFVGALAMIWAPTGILGAIFLRGGTFVKPPCFSWFTKAQIKELGWKSSDVNGIIDASVKEIEDIITLNAQLGKAVTQLTAINKKISLLRAEEKREEAINLREQLARLSSYSGQMVEAAVVYEMMIRRTMYFATNIAQAAKKCII